MWMTIIIAEGAQQIYVWRALTPANVREANQGTEKEQIQQINARNIKAELN